MDKKYLSNQFKNPRIISKGSKPVNCATANVRKEANPDTLCNVVTV